MTKTTRWPTTSKQLLSSGLLMGLGAVLVPLGGCGSMDSYMNPSITGRWEHTPTRVPILEHLAAIEDPDEQWVEHSEITAEDLTPQIEMYRVGTGDVLTVSIWDLLASNQVEVLPRQIDQNGYIEIPMLGRVFVSGLTEKEVAKKIGDTMVNLVIDPLVSVTVESRRQQTFHLMGNVATPGPYLIPSADFRLLQGLVAAGGIAEFIDEIYVIRQVPLDDSLGTLQPESLNDLTVPEGSTDQPDGEDLLDVIDDLSSPGMISGSNGGLIAPSTTASATTSATTSSAAKASQGYGDDPLIDLIDLVDPVDSGRSSQSTQNAQYTDGSAEASTPHSTPRWRFVNGQWARQTVPVAARKTIDKSYGMAPANSRGELFTQRVIRVPVEPLLAGDARFNIVLRPGDIVRVPTAATGNVYIDGQVNTPGVFNLPGAGRLTLTRAITSAGGLNGLAIPERVDLTRIVGHNEQATIMLNLRAIAEGTQPDVYIKPDDRINVGTNFWATPMAVVRSGFRTSYGFGFLLDRNFGNDVFGPPPFSRTN